MDELVASEVDLMMLQGLTKLKVPGDREEALTNATSSTEQTEDPKIIWMRASELIHTTLVQSRS